MRLRMYSNVWLVGKELILPWVGFGTNSQLCVLFFPDHLWVPLKIPLRVLPWTLSITSVIKASFVCPFQTSYCQLVDNHPKPIIAVSIFPPSQRGDIYNWILPRHFIDIHISHKIFFPTDQVHQRVDLFHAVLFYHPVPNKIFELGPFFALT